MSSGDWHDLFAAACRGDLELVRFHLAQGVDPSYVHPEIQATTLVTCLLAGQEDAAHLLLDHGADPVQVSALDELTPLQAARSAGVASVEHRLLALGIADGDALPDGRPRRRRLRRGSSRAPGAGR